MVRSGALAWRKIAAGTGPHVAPSAWRKIRQAVCLDRGRDRTGPACRSRRPDFLSCWSRSRWSFLSTCSSTPSPTFPVRLSRQRSGTDVRRLPPIRTVIRSASRGRNRPRVDSTAMPVSAEIRHARFTWCSSVDQNRRLEIATIDGARPAQSDVAPAREGAGEREGFRR